MVDVHKVKTALLTCCVTVGLSWSTSKWIWCSFLTTCVVPPTHLPRLYCCETVVTHEFSVQVKKIMAVGPLLPKSVFNVLNHEVNQGEGQKDPCLQFLHSQRPNSVLFICYGSYAAISEPQVLELAKGLEAAGQPFLWILRPSHPREGTQLDDSAAVSALLPSG